MASCCIEGRVEMLSLIWVLSAVLLGSVLIYRWTDLERLRPPWAAWLLIVGAGTAVGIGLTSCLFLGIGIWAGSPRVAMAVELAALAWAVFEAHRRRREPPGCATGDCIPSADSDGSSADHRNLHGDRGQRLGMGGESER